MTPAKYLVIWGWLTGLLVLSAVLSGLPLSKAAIASLILTLSTVKAILVVQYYMHLKFDRRWLTAVVAFPFLIILLAVLLVFSSRLVTL